MELSILIPNYNYDCRDLLRVLSSQTATVDGVEIIVADDCSTNKAMAGCVADEACRLGVRYISMPKNGGRAVVRNALAESAEGQYLLFIDSDAMPAEPTFVADYTRMIGQADVVCGTVMSPEECPSPEVSLRWVYDHTSMPRFVAEKRRERPYDSFSSFCFMIRRDVFMRIRFDESFSGYGYEDTLFGSELKAYGASIVHRDIGCLHLGLEPNLVFMRKVEASNQTLLSNAGKIGQASSLLRMASKLKRLHLVGPAGWLYRCAGSAVRHRLVASARPSYRLLQMYKLLHLCSLIAEERRK